MQEWQQRPTKGLFLFSRPSFHVLVTQRRTDGLVLRSLEHITTQKSLNVKKTNKHTEMDLYKEQKMHLRKIKRPWSDRMCNADPSVQWHYEDILLICGLPSLHWDVSSGYTTALHCWPAAASHQTPPYSLLSFPLPPDHTPLAGKLKRHRDIMSDDIASYLSPSLSITS